MGLFSKSPDETCPRCGGPKPASLPLCTTCKFKDAADASPLGFPGSAKEKEARRGGHAPPLPAASPALTGGVHSAPSRDVYAVTAVNYPVRARNGMFVRSTAEAAVADALFEKGVAFAYETTVAGHRPTFFVPARQLAIEVDGPGSPLGAWQRPERDAAYRSYGFQVLRIAAGADARAEVARAVSA